MSESGKGRTRAKQVRGKTKAKQADEGASAKQARSESGKEARYEFAAPIVTIFGGGITGLSAAHELIERGFRVIVVEKEASPDEEYACEVGGLARTQFRRVPLFARDVREHLARRIDAGDDSGSRKDASRARSEEEWADAEEREWELERIEEMLGARDREMMDEVGRRLNEGALDFQPSQPRFPTPERLVFQRDGGDPRKSGWTDVPDLRGRKNLEKLNDVYEKIHSAHEEYRPLVEARLTALGLRSGFDPSRPPKKQRVPGTPHTNDTDAQLILRVLILVYTDDSETESKNKDDSWRVGNWVKEELLRIDGGRIPNLGAMLQVRGMRSARSRDIVPPPHLAGNRAWARFKIVEAILPGEHGYRYFPAFYRHIFDVMRRTSIFDGRGGITHETAFDQLVPAPDVALAFRDAPGPDGEGAGYLKEFPRRRASSSKQLREALDLTFRDMGVTERDLLHYQMQLLRFATSCTARRRGYEEVSWWDYLRGRVRGDDPMIDDDDDSDSRNHVYSKRMTKWLREIPQALAAMESSETDARTHGTITLQLLYDDLGAGERSDFTLNGPTSVVWLRPWKRFLKRQGVVFCHGSLDSLSPDGDGDELVPKIADHSKPSRPHLLLPEPFGIDGPSAEHLHSRKSGQPPAAFDLKDSGFFILAVPLLEAVKLLLPHEQSLQSDLKKLLHFAREACLIDESKQYGTRPLLARDTGLRDSSGRPNPSFRYPLRDLAGVQFFFPSNVRIGHGHVYYADAEWGLSSVSQIAYWRERPGAANPFLGQISVDIGDWYEPYFAGGEERCAWECSADEIARFTWDQIRASTSKARRDYLPQPAFYHLDEGIEFARNKNGTRITNRTPFLLNLPGQWGARPGLYPRVRRELGDDIAGWGELYPDGRRSAPPFDQGAPGHGTSPEIFYQVSNKRWVLAGTHMATYTRLNTMEAANESARHAVNAILHKLMRAKDEREADEVLYNSEGKLLGEECEIWNPEDREWDDLEPLKRVDAALHAEGFPHFLDILRIPDLIGRVPHRKRDSGRPIYGLMRLLDLARTTTLKDWGSTVAGVESMGEEIEQQLRTLLRQLGLERS